jgi:uncharacterized membrane protein
MTAALASSASAPWPPVMPGLPTSWRFARVMQAAGTLQFEWLLRRNLSLSPAQLFGVYLSLCAVSLAIALGFAWQGASPVLAYAGVELVLVGVALLAYARHAADHERIMLNGTALAVEHQRGVQTERVQFRAAWVRVEPLADDRSLIELTGEGRSARVGRYLRPDLRQALAQELRAALRARREPAPLPATAINDNESEAK